MTAVECPRCWKARWHATGLSRRNRFDRVQAQLVCDVCGYAFASGRNEALDAANVVRATSGEEPLVFESFRDRPLVAPVAPAGGGIVPPQPSLPMARHGFEPVRTLVGAVAGDFKARAAGEREPGEDG